MPNFTGHAKKVTLNMAFHSAAVAENEELRQALEEAHDAGWDLNAICKPSLELIYAEFDDALEEKIRAEYSADPEFLIDLGAASGVCPLCGHVGCRWLFNLRNKAGGDDIQCGSECIISYGLNVQGAETAEHAKKILEARIRKEIKKHKIEAWHKDSGFSEDLFQTLESELASIEGKYDLPSKVRSSAYYKRYYDLPKLKKFYDKNGWLNTEKRWNEWRRIAGFARKFHGASKLPYPKEWVSKKMAKAVKTPVAAKQSGIFEEAVAAEPAKVLEAAPAPGKQITMTFDGIASELVFGK